MQWDQIPMSVLVWIVFFSPLCAIPGAIVGNAKNAAARGFLLGFLFGPFGVAAAFALDGRPKCQACQRRIESFEPGFDADVETSNRILCAECGASNPVPDRFASPDRPSQTTPRNVRTCPDCNGLVSRRVQTCPHCGCPLHASDALDDDS